MSPFLDIYLDVCLSQSQAELPSSLPLQSSSSLGTGKVLSHQEIADKLEDKDVRRAVEGRAGKRKRRSGAYETTILNDDNNHDGESTDDETRSLYREKESHVQKENLVEFVAPTLPAVVEGVGSALQRNSDGTVIAPRVRQKTGDKKVRYNLVIGNIQLTSLKSLRSVAGAARKRN